MIKFRCNLGNQLFEMCMLIQGKLYNKEGYHCLHYVLFIINCYILLYNQNHNQGNIISPNAGRNNCSGLTVVCKPQAPIDLKESHGNQLIQLTTVLVNTLLLSSLPSMKPSYATGQHPEIL